MVWWLDFAHRILEEEIKVSFGGSISETGNIQRNIDISAGCMKRIKMISTNLVITDC